MRAGWCRERGVIERAWGVRRRRGRSVRVALVRLAHSRQAAPVSSPRLSTGRICSVLPLSALDAEFPPRSPSRNSLLKLHRLRRSCPTKLKVGHLERASSCTTGSSTTSLHAEASSAATSAVGERGAGGAGRAGMTSLVERRSEARRLASARDHFARFCVAETLSEGVCRETREQPRWTHLLDPALLYRLDVVVVLVGPHVQHDIPTRAAHMRIVRLDGTLLAFVPRPDRRRARPHAQVASLLLVSVRSVRLLPACGVGRWCVRACSWLWIGLQGRVVWLGYGEREWRGGGRWGRSTREREGPRGRRPRQG